MGFLITGLKSMVLSQLIAFLFPMAIAVDPNCNYYQQMQPAITYYVYNKEYPNIYTGAQNCLWRGVAPSNYKIEISCKIEMPSTSQCTQDKLLISLTGDSNFKDGHTYCGFGNTTLMSLGNNISIALITSQFTQGGRFLCSMIAKAPPTPPAPSCDCGWKFTRRIVGGVETKVNEFPMMAALIDATRRDLYCGSTIISTRYAVTAAHCLTRRSTASVGLLVGDHNITSGTETSASKLMRVVQFIIHPNFNENDPKDLNDIGIVKTEQPIEFNLRVGPACLPFRYYMDTFAGKTVDALGWGTTEFTGPKSEVLLKTDLNVLSPSQCKSQINADPSQLCTFKKGHDACQSDSGGPILWQDPNSRIQFVAVIASGIGCASSRPAINTRITSYLMWITSNTPDAQYCVK